MNLDLNECWHPDIKNALKFLGPTKTREMFQNFRVVLSMRTEVTEDAELPKLKAQIQLIRQLETKLLAEFEQ